MVSLSTPWQVGQLLDRAAVARLQDHVHSTVLRWCSRPWHIPREYPATKVMALAAGLVVVMVIVLDFVFRERNLLCVVVGGMIKDLCNNNLATSLWSVWSRAIGRSFITSTGSHILELPSRPGRSPSLLVCHELVVVVLGADGIANVRNSAPLLPA